MVAVVMAGDLYRCTGVPPYLGIVALAANARRPCWKVKNDRMPQRRPGGGGSGAAMRFDRLLRGGGGISLSGGCGGRGAPACRMTNDLWLSGLW